MMESWLDHLARCTQCHRILAVVSNWEGLLCDDGVASYNSTAASLGKPPLRGRP